MHNFRWGIIAAVFALLISVALGMISGVRLLDMIFRAFIFAVIFFGIGFGLRFIVNSFFPELLYTDEEAAAHDIYGQPGSKIDITIDSTGEYAVPELFKTADGADELGNIEDLISGIFRPKTEENTGFAAIATKMGTESLDSEAETGYNDAGFFPEDDGFQELSIFQRTAVETQAETPAVFQPQFTPSFGDDSGLGGLPDLDMMARAFSSAYDNSPAAAPASPVSQSSMPSPPTMASAPQPVETFEPERRYAGNKPQPLEGDFDPKSLAEGLRTVLSKDK